MQRTPKWTLEDGLILRGQTALYRASGDARYRDSVLVYMKEGVSPDGRPLPGADLSAQPYDLAACGKALFFALEVTGEERYRKALNFVAERVKERPLPGTPEGLYAIAPFLMEYDTRFGGKQTYRAVAGQFKAVHQALFDMESGLYRSANGVFSYRNEGLMLLALADTAEKLDRMIYEHYRTVADIFLEAVRRPYQRGTNLLHLFSRDKTEETRDLTGSAMCTAAIIKGVRLQLLDEEKYLPPALLGHGNLYALHAAGIPCDPGAWMLLQAEGEAVKRL